MHDIFQTIIKINDLYMQVIVSIENSDLLPTTCFWTLPTINFETVISSPYNE
jgi:hypothetical protein